ncbi:NHLP bacteriocin system secretion protein [Paraliomyxa miuraensis]|uniref:NHLP bacteriocin system secretion protein n=1 Tax=Paraliomyxa miuraensis TaxID=376150 RepID=UPI002257E7DC|nr:NHLP bacteriocin system secretion protein [Paraliomyxa miuraensis]MCX4241596.1 NHLP bacteriocin system secretion protein [Paraliomyxa miuraensis]
MASKSSHVFRKIALERISSPEHLDRQLVLIRPREWLAAVVLAVLTGCVIAWSIAGSLPTNVEAEGIIIRQGGMQEVVSLAMGQVTVVHPKVGDFVAEGEAIAELAQTELITEIDNKQAQLSELRIRHQELLAFGTANIAKRARQTKIERDNLRRDIDSARRRLEWLKKKLVNQQALHAQGIVLEDEVQQTRLEIADEEADVRAWQALLGETSVAGEEQQEQRLVDIQTSEMRIHEAERALRALQDRLQQNSTVTSPHAGRVIEQRVNPGDLVAPGSPILSIDPTTVDVDPAELEVLLYVRATEGKKIRSGMRVRISPSTAKREEFGFIEGEVSSVSQFPASRRGMLRMLGNEELVVQFLAGGPALAVIATLSQDPTTSSGFEWSSGEGPDEPLTSGTPCTATITVREQAPITLVLPALRKALGS